MSDKNTRRTTVRASEYENRMDRLDRAPSKLPVSAWGGKEAGRISQAMLDPDTDATKLSATLMGRPSLKQREQGRKPSVQHSVRLSEPMDEYVSAAIKREGLKNRSEYFRMLVQRNAETHHTELVGARNGTEAEPAGSWRPRMIIPGYSALLRLIICCQGKPQPAMCAMMAQRVRRLRSPLNGDFFRWREAPALFLMNLYS